MNKKNLFSSLSFKTVSMALLLFLIFGTAAYSQSERDRNHPDMPRNGEINSNYESPESATDFRHDSHNRTSVTKDSKPTTSSTPTTRKENPIYKQGGEKDGKREGTSTLSFNLFLYVVDKFKED